MNFLSVAARKIRTAAGTLLSIGAISDGHILTRSGTTVAGASGSTIRTTIGATKTWQKTAAPTVNDDTNSGYVAGDLWNDTTNNRTYVADSVAAGAADWRSLLPVSRIVADISGGAWRAAGYTSVNGTWVRVTDYLAPSYTQDPETWGYSLSGTDILSTTGAGVVDTNLRTEAPGWSWALSAFGVGSLANPRMGAIDASVSSISLTSAGASDWHGVAGVYSTASNLSTGALYASGVARASGSYGWIRCVASNSMSGYGIGSTTRRIQAHHVLPLLVNADPDIYAYDGAGAITVADSAEVGNTASGTPTHVGVFLVKLGTPRAGTIATPSVTFDLGSG